MKTHRDQYNQQQFHDQYLNKAESPQQTYRENRQSNQNDYNRVSPLSGMSGGDRGYSQRDAIGGLQSKLNNEKQQNDMILNLKEQQQQQVKQQLINNASQKTLMTMRQIQNDKQQLQYQNNHINNFNGDYDSQGRNNNQNNYSNSGSQQVNLSSHNQYQQQLFQQQMNLQQKQQILAQEFYKRQTILNDGNNNFTNQDYNNYLNSNSIELEEGSSDKDFIQSDIGYTSVVKSIEVNNNNNNVQGFNLYSGPSSVIAYSQSTGGIKSSSQQHHQQQKDLKQVTCTEFDLTAKEISSNKRFEKIKKNTIISGLNTDHSPIDGQPSNSETVKWAFTNTNNKDSQETQKKVSIINRESINAQDMISRSLKSHDSRAQISQQTTSQKNLIPNLKGKMLDFANVDQSSALFFEKQQQSHLFGHGLNTNESQQNFNQLQNEEERMISFLEDGTNLLMSSNKKGLTITNLKQNYNSNQSQQQNYHANYKKQSENLKNRKYCSLLKFSLPDNMQTMIENTQDCPLCNKQKVFDSSLQCSKIEEPKSCQDIVMINLNKKYLTSREYYNVKIINDIIYNEQTHIVSVFKDYLIFDDISEFLKRFYNKLESVQRLPKMYEFYEKFSKVFPNYVTLPENKYLFKNIEKKQRIIDEKQRILQEQEEKKQREAQGYQLGQSAEKMGRSRHKDRFSSQQMQNSSIYSQMSTNRMFNTQFIESVANIQASGIIEKSSMMSSRINNSQYQEHVLNSSILIHQHLQQNMEQAAKNKQKRKPLNELDFDELISKFIAKDTQSQIQQSSLMTSTFDREEQQQVNKNLDVKSQQQGVKKPQVYEYQENKPHHPNIQQPKGNIAGSTILNSDKSQTLSDGISSGRPTSSKPKDQKQITKQPLQDQKQKQQMNHQAMNQFEQNQQQKLTQEYQHQNFNSNNEQQQQLLQPHQTTSSNHLIINNYLQDKNQVQKQCDIIINIASSNIITSQNLPSDRNYYDYNMQQYNSQSQQQELARIKVISNQDGQQQIVHIPQQQQHNNVQLEQQQQPLQEVKINSNQVQQSNSRQGSLQRNISRSNLHNMQTQQKSADINMNKNVSTPNRASSQNKEVKTPGSGKTGDNQIKTNLVQQKILKKIRQQNKQDLLLNQQDLQSNMISLSGNNKSASLITKSNNTNDHTQSPLNIYSQRQPIYTMNVNSVKGNTEAVVSRELSKEKNRQQQQQQLQLQQQYQPVNLSNKQNALFINQGQQNQMFKNDIISNLTGRINFNTNQVEYSNNGNNMGMLNNIRSIERLNKIEEEIQKDYSKYVNEYGLSKTAFAKAVNSLREKQSVQNSNQKQQVTSQPSTTRQARIMQSSNEKKRNNSNNPRSISTSQNRRQSNSRQQNVKATLQAQESVNDIYLNTNRNDQKQIRSVRAKTHMNSQNSSSCFQKSQKMSPDKITGTQFGIQNILGMTQNMTTNFNSNNSNYLTLKAQPQKQGKGIKIKFPINNASTQRTNSKNQNQSQNQTPKRIKLQKTKSSSNIPATFRQQPQSQVLLSHRGRIGDMMILDEMSQQMNATNNTTNNPLQYIPLSNQGRATQNQQELYGPGIGMNNNNDNQGVNMKLMGSGFFPPQAFNSNSCLGTYTTTSILNSPLSFKNNLGLVQQNQLNKEQNYQATRNNSKGRQSSRNGQNSNHQSQKSINGMANHQRGTSNSNLLSSSTNKQKKIVTINPNINNESKRMSTGSNMSKKTTPIHHQPQNSKMQQQILQLLMTYQNQQQQPQQSIDMLTNENLTGVNASQLNGTLRLLQNGNHAQSMKDLKSFKQQQTATSTVLKDLQIIKAPKHQQNNNAGVVLQQQQPSLNTHRSNGAQSILMIDNQNSRKQSKAGKMTQRGESNKKTVIQQHNIVNPYQANNNDFTTSISTNNHYSNIHGNITSNDLSSRIQSSLGGIGFNYGDNTSSNIDVKRLLNQSKSQENLDLIRQAAQRAALENQQQNTLYTINTNNLSATNKFLQNLKQQENQISLSSKIKMLPTTAMQNLPQQSARNVQFDSTNKLTTQQQPNDSDQKINNIQYMQQQQVQNQVQYNKGGTNIIIGSHNFDKPSSRRTSGKFNPQSTRSNQQQ